MNCDFTSAQRLLVQGITASTLLLVRSLRDGCSGEALRQLMSDRRRMLGELASAVDHPVLLERLAYLQAAVTESDRTVEQLAC